MTAATRRMRRLVDAAIRAGVASKTTAVRPLANRITLAEANEANRTIRKRGRVAKDRLLREIADLEQSIRELCR